MQVENNLEILAEYVRDNHNLKVLQLKNCRFLHDEFLKYALDPAHGMLYN